jgi:cobalamin-dependent methionine synthase I
VEPHNALIRKTYIQLQNILLSFFLQRQTEATIRSFLILDLKGTHKTVGLSNFSWGTPKYIRENLEKAYLTIAMQAGLDFAIANPEKVDGPLPAGHKTVSLLESALQQGRVMDGESQEMAGYRQAEAVMEIWKDSDPEDS